MKDNVVRNVRRRISATFLVTILTVGFTSVLLASSPQQANAETLSPWTSTTVYPSNITDQSCVTSGGYIYCVGGLTNSSFTPINSVYYAPLSSSGVGMWTTTTNYPTNIFRHSCVISGGYIYCVGGQTGLGPATDAVYYASLSSSGVGTWTTTASYPYGIAQQACVTSGSFIYCTGPGAVVYYAPISSAGVGEWTLSTTSLPVSVIYSSAQACVASGSYIYCVGGALPFSGSPHTNAVYYAPFLLSGALGNWTLDSINYPARIIEQSCSTSGNYIYCVGGTTFSNPFQGMITNSTYFAPISSSGGVGAWTNTASYPTGVTDESCVVSGGFIYCVGGLSATDAVYYASITTTSQTSSQLTVNTQDTGGNAISGYYTALYDQGGNLASTGFSPAKFTLTDGQAYTVQVDDYGSCHFDHWADTGSNNAQRTISISADTHLTAVYSCVTSTTDISTTNGLGGSLTGYYTTLSTPDGTTLQSCFSPCSFTVDNGQTYVVTVANYGYEAFNHWSDTQGIVNSWGGSYLLPVPNSSTSTTISLIAVYSP